MAYDPYFTEQVKYPWVKFVSFEELLAQSDVVSVHAPLNKEATT